jgi:hypothetical protein
VFGRRAAGIGDRGKFAEEFLAFARRQCVEHLRLQVDCDRPEFLIFAPARGAQPDAVGAAVALVGFRAGSAGR